MAILESDGVRSHITVADLLGKAEKEGRLKEVAAILRRTILEPFEEYQKPLPNSGTLKVFDLRHNELVEVGEHALKAVATLLTTVGIIGLPPGEGGSLTASSGMNGTWRTSDGKKMKKGMWRCFEAENVCKVLASELGDGTPDEYHQWLFGRPLPTEQNTSSPAQEKHGTSGVDGDGGKTPLAPQEPSNPSMGEKQYERMLAGERKKYGNLLRALGAVLMAIEQHKRAGITQSWINQTIDELFEIRTGFSCSQLDHLYSAAKSSVRDFLKKDYKSTR